MEERLVCCVLGAGEESLHSIRTANSLGLKTLALDKDPNAAGMCEASQAFDTDISDSYEVLRVLKDKSVAFLLPVPIGRYITTWGRVNEELHLKGISRDAASACADKHLFHQKLAAKHLRECPSFLIKKIYATSGSHIFKNRSESVLDQLAKEQELDLGKLEYPMILKPRFGSGSRNVISIKDEETLKEVLSEPFSEDLVLERDMPGEEYGADGAVIDGKVFLVLLRKKLNTERPVRQAIGYLSVFEETLSEKALSFLTGIVQALGVDNSLFHCDLILSEKGDFFPIEFSGRPSGHNLYDVFTPLATGVDMVQEYIRFQMGKPYDFKPKCQRKMILHFWNLPEGEVSYVPQYYDFNLPEDIGLRVLKCCLHVGDQLLGVKDGHSLVPRGYFIIEDEVYDAHAASELSEKKLISAAKDVLAEVIVKIPSGL